KPVLRSMELGPRDRLSQAFVHEQQKGRTFKGPYGDYVHLDIRHLGQALIDKKLPFVRELCLKYENLDPVKEPIPVRPVIHYMMGGIHTDIHGATPVPGLVAAGEAACVSINGANRLGSNSLTEILVFGARAGHAAAAYAAGLAPPQAGPATAIYAQGRDEQQRLERDYLRKDGPAAGGERLSSLREEMQKTMEDSAGIYRTAATLEQAAAKMRDLQARFRNLRLDDRSYTFNTELLAALELGFMLDVADTIVASALARRESRGSHQRTDFPQRDDLNFLAHSLAARPEASGGDAAPRISYLPVTITRWPPGQRVYGK
ncbi:MAG: FAD-binding protein, partial [Candidatus Acidiferrales bacterium]